MAGHTAECAFEEDGVHAVDIVVKSRGVARLMRLTERGDIEAALTVLKRRGDDRGGRPARGTGERTRDGDPDREAASGSAR